MLEDNIAAISTSPLPGGVAVIRISGSSPLDVAKKMFKCKTDVYNFEPNKMYVGNIDCGDFIDHGMCVYFKAPKSFTGEDMVEFHCHGGLAITKGVLNACLKNGARLAERGEYTKRAFLNGKMSLSSCEGLIDMINSQSVAEAKSGFYLYREKLSTKIKNCENDLLYVLALIDANIDYPEEDIKSCELDEVKTRLLNVAKTLQGLISTFDDGSKLKNGVKVAIVGKPNAGKSSILNNILNVDKAIVTDIAGTTRDVVEGEKEIDGVRFCFYDTAGIHDSDDVVEKIGIDRSKKIVEHSDVILFVVDGSNNFDNIDKDILNLVKNKNVITIKNKSDLPQKCDYNCDICVSTLLDDNIDKLQRLIVEKSGIFNIDINGDYLTEMRHYEALSKAFESINIAINSVGVMPLDIITIDIRSALVDLGLISGSTADENVINEIFSKFCVGK